MPVLDRTEADKLMLRLEEEKCIDTRYSFCRQKDELCLLGSGGSAYVYEMYDVNMPDRHYAAKVIGIKGDITDSDSIRKTTQIQSFLSEQCENVVRIIAVWTMKLFLDGNGNVQKIFKSNDRLYDAAEGAQIYIILMEKLEEIISVDRYRNAELLVDELKSEAEIIRFAKDIGNALFAAHKNSCLHRDVKLENIFWDNDNKCYKLGDFGVARYVGPDGADTVLYTEGYGAPEIREYLAASYNLTADIYSFGITLYLLFNELKFPASDKYSAVPVQYSEDFVVPAPGNASSDMAGIIRVMCSYYKEDRYQSVEEILLEIENLEKKQEEEKQEEYEDLATETYREETDMATEAYSEMRSEKNKNRRSKRQIRKEEEAFDASFNLAWDVISAVVVAVISFALLMILPSNAGYIAEWQFCILPVLLLFEAACRYIKDFRIESLILVIVFLVYCISKFGFDIPMAIIMLSAIAALSGKAYIPAGCGIGTIIWILKMLL